MEKREVMFKKWIPIRYEANPNTDIMERVEGTGIYEEGFSQKGELVHWGVRGNFYLNSGDIETVAVIELPDGTVTECATNNIKFVK